MQQVVDHDTIKIQAQASDPLVAAAMHAVQLRTPLYRPYKNHGKFLINSGILCRIFY